MKTGEPNVRPRDHMSYRHDLVVSHSATSLTLRSVKSHQPSMGSNTTGIQAPLKRSNKVLCFYGYFMEAVNDSYLENFRVRRCEIYYYLEDDSMQIVEPKQENSGVPQGNFMKRHRVPKSEDDYFTISDLDVGCSIQLYGRIFHVNGCNESTRICLRDIRGSEPMANTPPPVDRYEKERRDLMSRETGKDPLVSHNIQKNPMKVFAEAALGNTVDNSGRRGFLIYGTSVLRFYCFWDDSVSLYGDVQMFKLHYFLYDNTIEILTVHSPNSGRDSYPLLLKRAKLPKPCGGFYHWADFNIGCIVNAYSRMIKLIDADRATRDFYRREDIELGPPLTPPLEIHPVALERMPPPYSGFGSEEDSLTSCAGSLVQKAPAKQQGEDGVLRYQAAFANPKPEDCGRLFVIVYFSTEFSLMIREPPQRNSGVVGGNFLAKMKLKHTSGKLVTAADLVIGATLTLASHTFIILNADEATLKYMELRPKQFPHSDIGAVLNLYKQFEATCLAQSTSLNATTNDISNTNDNATKVDFGTFQKILGFLVPQSMRAPPKQAVITLWRHYNKNGLLSIDELPFAVNFDRYQAAEAK